MMIHDDKWCKDCGLCEKKMVHMSVFGFYLNPFMPVSFCLSTPARFAGFPCGLRLVNKGIVAAAPPCSMYVAACASVHRRTKARPQGNHRNFKVRLAGRIWKNTVSGHAGEQRSHFLHDRS